MSENNLVPIDETPSISKDEVKRIAAGLGAMLKAATEDAFKAGQSRTYKELGLEWNDKTTKIQLPGLPSPMDVDVAIQNLLDFKALSLQTYSINEFLPGMPYDAAYAFVQVLKERYGWVNPQTKMTIFGPEPPQMVSVRYGAAPSEFVEVPVGKFKLPDITADIETGFRRNPKGKTGSFLSFVISAEVKHEDRKVIQELITRTREYVEKNSIYRGKAMRLGVGSNGMVEELVEPSFIDLSKVSEEGLVLTDVNYSLINHTVWTPIRKTAIARKHNVSLKRGALLYGPYGTGKTLTALVTAKIAVEHGWTYIMLDDPKGLVQALEMAKLYQPAVVFAEDIDRVVTSDRTDRANDILNTIDGAVQKNSEIITVLTTNHIDKINEAMLRPGRLDALVHVTKPDAKAAERLVRLYAGNLLAQTESLDELGVLIEQEGFIPAIIAELVNRGKLGMIFREGNHITQQDLLVQAHLLRDHSKLLQKDKVEPSAAEAVGLSLKRLLGDPASTYDGDLEEDIENIKDRAYGAYTNASESNATVQEELPRIRKLLQGASNGTGGYGDILAEMKRKLDSVAAKVGVN